MKGGRRRCDDKEGKDPPPSLPSPSPTPPLAALTGALVLLKLDLEGVIAALDDDNDDDDEDGSEFSSVIVVAVIVDDDVPTFIIEKDRERSLVIVEPLDA